MQRGKRPAGGASQRADPMPEFVAPCLATLSADLARGDAWVHEIKFDGYRLQARIESGEVRLLTRTGLDWTSRFGTLVAALGQLPVTSAILDGEVIVPDEHGASNFGMLVDALKAGRTSEMAYYVFDLMYLDGVDVTRASLLERKALLETLLSGLSAPSPLRYSAHMACDAQTMFEEACKLGLEGIVSKRIGSGYRSGRRDEWRKTKCLLTDEFVIGGYIEHATIKGAIGSLACGYYDGGTLVYAGRVGTGWDHDTAAGLWDALQPLRRKSMPFAVPPETTRRRELKFVEPKFVAQLDYRGWSADGIVRHAVFKGLREDKPAAAVRRPTGGGTKSATS